MGYKKWVDIVGEVDDEMREEIETAKAEARADSIAFNLAELRKSRHMTQVELAKVLNRAQTSVSAMENSDDNLMSTLRTVVEKMGGSLEIVAVFDDERIALMPPSSEKPETLYPHPKTSKINPAETAEAVDPEPDNKADSAIDEDEALRDLMAALEASLAAAKEVQAFKTAKRQPA